MSRKLFGMVIIVFIFSASGFCVMIEVFVIVISVIFSMSAVGVIRCCLVSIWLVSGSRSV